MKKFLALMLALLMMATVLCACGDDEETVKGECDACGDETELYTIKVEGEKVKVCGDCKEEFEAGEEDDSDRYEDDDDDDNYGATVATPCEMCYENAAKHTISYEGETARVCDDCKAEWDELMDTMEELEDLADQLEGLEDLY